MHQSRHNGRLPDFMLVGSAKSATTTIYKYLKKHPEIFMCTPKEPEFFARDDIFRNGIDWYASLFSGSKSDQICGEASVIYTLWPHFPRTAERVAKYIPDVKLIYIVRNPIERAYSFYTQLIKNYQNDTQDYIVHRTFEECIFPDRFKRRASREKFYASFDQHYPDVPGVFIDGSMYAMQLNYLYEYISRKNILVLLYEEFSAQPDVQLEKICRFLQISDQFDFGVSVDKSYNVSKKHFQNSGELYFVQMLKEWKIIRVLARLSPPGFGRCLLRQFNRLTGSSDMAILSLPAPMRPETRRELEAMFLAPNRELERLVELDLSCWRKEH